MNTEQFILTLSGTIIGTLIGGFVVICTNWISAQRTRRESVQDWYKQTYLTEGVDPLITFFVDLQFRWNWNAQQLKNLNNVPVAALAKIQVLLDNDVLTQLAIFIQNYLADTQIDVNTQITLLQIGETLLDLRKELLKIIPVQVNEKNYQVTLPGFKQRFQTIQSNLQTQNLAKRG